LPALMAQYLHDFVPWKWQRATALGGLWFGAVANSRSLAGNLAARREVIGEERLRAAFRWLLK
jgi:hypothetical protein